jgi:hypothetical protein
VHPDIRAVAQGVPGIPNGLIQGARNQDAMMFDHVHQHLLERTYPEASETLRYQLRQESDHWVVWLGLLQLDEAVKVATAAQSARSDLDIDAERRALEKLLGLAPDAAGSVVQLQALASQRLTEMAEESKTPAVETERILENTNLVEDATP